MGQKRPYLLTFSILVSSLLATALGGYWNETYYHETAFTADSPVLATAMQGIHDGLLAEPADELAHLLATSAGVIPETAPVGESSYYARITQDREQTLSSLFDGKEKIIEEDLVSLEESAEPLSFTTATDDYFADAVFIGDSRTVGISEYSGIENATFLCKTSLSIYDFEKNKITFENKKTSIKEVLSERQFGKIYLMLGINECDYGTSESFFEAYSAVVETIRELQPNALIFIEGNLLVTKEKSDSNATDTNQRLSERNALIATLANGYDTFYIDINESSLCEDGSLIADYTWDQVHIKAQYYSVWKEFLLEHAILTTI